MKEDDPLDDLCDVLEDPPDQHDLPNLNKLELDRLALELSSSLRGLLVEESELRVLRSLEEVEIPHKVGWIVNFPCKLYTIKIFSLERKKNLVYFLVWVIEYNSYLST